MARDELIEARLTYSVIGAFFEVYNRLGFGFFESIYANALECELTARGHRLAREVSVQVVYKGNVIGIQRLDMIVDDKLVAETKSSHELQKGATRQVQSYLHSTHLKLGLLLHFGPSPRFYRFLGRATTSDATFPLDPNHPNCSCPCP